MAEHELTGKAFTGVVTDRDEERTVPGDRPGSALWRPSLTVRCELPVPMPAGTAVKSPARPGQKAAILDVVPDGAGPTVLIQLNGGFANKRKPPAPEGTMATLGETVTFTSIDPQNMPSRLPDDEDTPWTHGGPPQPYEPTGADAEEASA
ncbi:hypothetical protein ACWGN5_03400 [Streptomyces sp. NPDC055815]